MDHFRIRLTMEDVPEETHAVTYELHESYYDPIREVRDEDDDFAEEITSFGDSDVKAIIRSRGKMQVVSEPLSKALEKRYGAHMGESVRAALARIKDL